MNQDHSKEIVALVPGVRLEPLYRDLMLDCRLFLLGDRYRRLLRAYAEAIYRLTRSSDLTCTAADVLESAEIRQYYDVSVADGCVKLTGRDAAFQEPYP